jgi:hypothetical protein
LKCSVCGERIVKGDAGDCTYVEHLLVHLLEKLDKLDLFMRLHTR